MEALIALWLAVVARLKRNIEPLPVGVQLEFPFMADTHQNCAWCKRFIPSSTRVVDEYGQYCSARHKEEAGYLRYAHGI